MKKKTKPSKTFNIFSLNQLLFIKKLCGLYKWLEPITPAEKELAEDLENNVDTFIKDFYEIMKEEE